MSQLSRPYQIALVALLVFAAAWFLVLKPGGGDDAAGAPLPGEPGAAAPAAPKAPGQAGLESAVSKAKSAVATSERAPANGLSDQAAEDPEATTAATGTATPKAAATGTTGASAAEQDAADGDRAKPLLDAVAGGKVVALLFYNPKATDDRATRRALLSVPRRGGRLVVRAVSVKDVAQYQAITSGVPVQQSPTLMVFGADKQARTLTGYADTRSIDQLVGDVGGKQLSRR